MTKGNQVVFKIIFKIKPIPKNKTKKRTMEIINCGRLMGGAAAIKSIMFIDSKHIHSLAIILSKIFYYGQQGANHC